MENTKKITPGEWFQSHRKIPNDRNGMYSTQVYCEKGETIASISWYMKPKESAIYEGKPVLITGTYREGNAKLIAAAPTLLTACENALRDIQKLNKDLIAEGKHGYILMENELFDAINKALNKALCSKNRIKSPNSNVIAEFVKDYLKPKEFKPCGEGENICNCKDESECGYIVDLLERREDKNLEFTYTVVEFIGRCNLYQEKKTSDKWFDDNGLFCDTTQELIEYIKELENQIYEK